MQWFLFLFLRSVIGNNPWSGMKQRFQSCCSASVFAKSMHYCPTQGSSSRWQNKANYISAFSDCQNGIVTLCIPLFYSNVSVGNTSFCKQCSVRRFLLAMLFCISIFVNFKRTYYLHAQHCYSLNTPALRGTALWLWQRTGCSAIHIDIDLRKRELGYRKNDEISTEHFLFDKKSIHLKTKFFLKTISSRNDWQWDVTTNGSINDTLDLSGGYPFRLNLLHRKFWEPSLKGGSHFIFMIFGPFSARDFFGMNYDVLILRLAIFHLGDIPIEAT